MPTGNRRILVLCTHNSARSQMAEGFLRHYLQNQAEIFSAGTEPSTLHPLSAAVMKEIGIDLAHHYAKCVEDLPYKDWDYVITVCDHARETCPYIPARHNLHYSFPDPSQTGTIEAFRAVRDQIHAWAKAFAETLLQEPSPS